MAKDLFDLHIKVSRTNNGEYCARTVLGNNAILFEGFSKHLSDAVCDVMVDMEHAGMWQVLEGTPTTSRWPFGTGSKITTTTSNPPAGVPTSKPASTSPAGAPTYKHPVPVPVSTPTPVPTTTPVTPAKKKQIPVKLQRPVDLSSVLRPDCEAMCQSFDIFGHVKCKSMCQGKKGV